MSFMFVFKARLFFENKEKAKIALESVKVEVGEKFEKRSKTKMSAENNCVLVQINSLDSISLKASVNSYLKLFLLSEKIMGAC